MNAKAILALISAGIIATLNPISTSETAPDMTFNEYDMSQFYPACGIVVSLETETNSVIYEDYNGNLWDFPEIDDWTKGDIVALIMCDNGTPNYIYDDYAVSYKYCGHMD